MADTTENISPNVTQAAPPDTTTEEGGEKTVQLAQAAAAVQVASPGQGAEDAIAVEAGLTYRLVDPVLRFTQDGGSLGQLHGLFAAVLAGDDCSARSLKGKEIRRFRPI